MDLVILGTAILAFVWAERRPRWRYEALPILRAFVASDLFYLLTGGLLLSFVMRAQATPWVGILGDGAAALLPGAPFPLVVGAAIVLHDFGGYVSHRMLHRFDSLWELHKVHHSSRSLDWLATFRAHILEHVLRNLLSPVLLILLGFPVAAVGLAGAVHAVSSMLGHANLRIRLCWLEPLLITPRLHRIHHVPASSETNFASMFTIWDRLFGTLETSPSAALAPIGVPDEIDTYPQGWWPQLREPFRRAAAGAPRAGIRQTSWSG